MLRHSTVVLGLVALVAVPAGAQRATGNADSTGLKQLLTLDSEQVPYTPTLSQDGKWLLFTRGGSAHTSSVWMAAAASPKPFRMTSDGYRDASPTLSPTGDRVFFLSNRPNRDSSSTATYIMSLPIDRMTGRPSGPVQQVTTDSVPYLPPHAISANGKWLAYTINPGVIRLVSAAGGNARTLATKFTLATYVSTFSADGQRVVFSDSGSRLIRAVSVNGGPVTTLYRAANGERLDLIPRRDDRYVLINSATRHTELRDRDGKTLGAVDVPLEGQSCASYRWAVRSDGLGWIWAKNGGCPTLNRLTLATGAMENVPATTPGDLVGMTVDGSVVTQQRGAGGVLTITSVSPGGKVDGKVTLGPEIRMIQGGPIQGGKLLLGLGPRYSHKAVLNGYGVDSAQAWQPAYLIDRITGAVKKLADSADYGCCFGPHGWSAGIAEAHGSTVEVKSIDANGATRLIHSFPRATYPHRMFYWGFVNGSRLAYLGTGDMSVSVTTGPEGSPKPITLTLAGGLQWSPDGRKLAVAFFDRQNNHRATVRVFDIAADGSAAGTGPALDLGFSGPGDFAGIEWLPDASAVLVPSYTEDANGCMGCIVLRPFNPARPAVRLIPSTGGMVGNYYVEPSGKSVLFEQTRSRDGASIWTADFLPPKKP